MWCQSTLSFVALMNCVVVLIYVVTLSLQNALKLSRYYNTSVKIPLTATDLLILLLADPIVYWHAVGLRSAIGMMLSFVSPSVTLCRPIVAKRNILQQKRLNNWTTQDSPPPNLESLSFIFVYHFVFRCCEPGMRRWLVSALYAVRSDFSATAGLLGFLLLLLQRFYVYAQTFTRCHAIVKMTARCPYSLYGCYENFWKSLHSYAHLIFPTFLMDFCSDRYRDCAYKIWSSYLYPLLR